MDTSTIANSILKEIQLLGLIEELSEVISVLNDNVLDLVVSAPAKHEAHEIVFGSDDALSYADVDENSGWGKMVRKIQNRIVNELSE